MPTRERPSSPLSSAYASLLSPVSPKCAAFKSTVKSLFVFVWYGTNSSPRFPFLKGYSPFSAFCLYFVSSLTDVSQTELIQWSQQKAKLFPIGRRPRVRVSNRHRPCEKAFPQISSRSRRQSFTFQCVFVALRSTGGPKSRFLLTELSFENHTQPSRCRHTKARLTKLRPDSHRPRYTLLLLLLLLCVPQTPGLECARSGNARWGYSTQFQEWRNFPQKFQACLGFLCWVAEFGTGNAFHLRNTARLYMDKKLNRFM